jgi:hypothetical protein
MEELVYFEKGDIVHFPISGESEDESIEISPNVTSELNDKGEMPIDLIQHTCTSPLSLNPFPP